MSSRSSLPSYTTQPSGAPHYTTEYPPPTGHRVLHITDRKSVHRSSGRFLKHSRSSGVSLCLYGQEPTANLPVYGLKGTVQGQIDLTKVDAVASVEVKIEGKLRLREIAEGGTTLFSLCHVNSVLWTRDNPQPGTSCPSSLSFRLNIPTTFKVEGKIYSLPSTFSAYLEGQPGFAADVDYSVTVVVGRGHTSLFGINIGSNIGSITVSTPFLYYPRTRPASPLPRPMSPSPSGFQEAPNWKPFQSLLRARLPSVTDITTTLFLPASQIYCMSQVIPFHLVLKAPSSTLAAYRPLGPSSDPQSTRRSTQLRILRQCTVDVRGTKTSEVNTDIWRVDPIGTGRFHSSSDGADWISYTGQISVDEAVKVAGFHAAGLTVKDCIALTITPVDPQRSPFMALRQTVSIHLTTHPWVPAISTSHS